MKKIILILIAVNVFFNLNLNSASAQDYKNEIGLGVDFGTGETVIGPSYKRFFNSNNAGVTELLFGDHFTVFNAFYQYHGKINDLRWYVGAGPSVHVFIYTGYNKTTIALKPMTGLAYKIPKVPLSLNIDWRPTLFIGLSKTNFETARFGFSTRYTF